MKMLFLKCQEKCLCSTKECEAIHLQQCSACKNVLKLKCGKKACKIDGEAPGMILVAARKEKTEKSSRKRKDGESDASEEEIDEEEVDAEEEGEESKVEIQEEERYEGMWNSTDDESFTNEEENEANESNKKLCRNPYSSIKGNTRRSILFYFWNPSASWTGSFA